MMAQNTIQAGLPATSRLQRYYIVAVLVSICILTQIAINIDTFPAGPIILFYGAAPFVLCKLLEVDFISVIMFVLFGIVAAAVLAITDQPVSSTALTLVVVLYLPFIFRARRSPESEAFALAFQRAFVDFSVFIAVVACVQLAVVNVLKISVLSNIANIIPENLLGVGTYTQYREESGIIKANGFFLRESATLSTFMALAILIEFYVFRRVRVISVLVAGELSSISGTGILILAVSILMPASKRGLIALAGIGFAALLLWSAADMIPGMSLWLGRLDEFGTEGSSGYARFQAPFEMVDKALNDSLLLQYFGHGAGSYARSVSFLNVKYEISDPTWAKLFYEYGWVGGGFLLLLVARRIFGGRMPLEPSLAIFYTWMVAGGMLVKPDLVALLWFLFLAKPVADQRSTKKVVMMQGRPTPGPREFSSVGERP